MPIVKALWFTLLLALANAAHAQDAPPPMHKFWDAQNTTIIVSVAALRAAEPDSIAHNTPALAAYSAAMVIVTATSMYVLHRTRHHRLERIVGWAHAAVLTGAVVNNFSIR